MDSKKLNQFSKKCQAEIADIYNDGCWTIVLKNHDRAISEETWEEVKWELKKMVKTGNYEMEF